MSITKIYPHYEVNTIDLSPVVAAPTTRMPLHRPLFLIQAPRGPVGVAKGGNFFRSSDIPKVFGKELFDYRTKYFGVNSVYLSTLMKRQGAYVIRLASDTAKTAHAIIEAWVITDAQIPQYQKDSKGNRVVDENGDYVPLLDGSNEPITTLGNKIEYRARVLASDENPNEIVARDVQSGGTTYKVFPLWYQQATSPGEWGNSVGMSISFDWSNGTIRDLSTSIGSPVYTFRAYEKPYGSNIATTIASSAQARYTNVGFYSNMENPYTTRRMYLPKVLENEYTDITFPFGVKVYDSSIYALRELIFSKESALNEDSIASVDMVEFLTCRDMDGRLYDTTQIITSHTESVRFSETYVIYMKNGNDGDMDWDTYEDLVRQTLDYTLYPELQDEGRFAYTNIYDVGFSMQTKEAILDHMAKNDSFKAIMSTQDINAPVNSEADDIASGTYLAQRARMTPESELYGTEAVRAEIYAHVGHLVDSQYEDVVPYTLQMLEHRCTHESTFYLEGTYGGWPDNQVTLFKDINWAAYSHSIKTAMWRVGINYVQYYNDTQLQIPSPRTVYTNDASALSNSLYSQILVYCKHLARRVWYDMVGRAGRMSDTIDTVEKRTSKVVREMLNSMYSSEVYAYQTEEEQLRGDTVHTKITVFGGPDFRNSTVDVICRRPEE